MVRWMLRILFTSLFLFFAGTWPWSYRYEVGGGIGGDRPVATPTILLEIREGMFYLAREEKFDLDAEDWAWGLNSSPIDRRNPYLLDYLSRFNESWRGVRFHQFALGRWKPNENYRYSLVYAPMWFMTSLTGLLAFWTWRKRRKPRGPGFPVEASPPGSP